MFKYWGPYSINFRTLCASKIKYRTVLQDSVAHVNDLMLTQAIIRLFVKLL